MTENVFLHISRITHSVGKTAAPVEYGFEYVTAEMQ